MVTFTARIWRFDKKGEKTGWSFVNIDRSLAEKLKPGCRISFRIRGKLDDHSIEKVSILPMGNGNFILPLNSKLRKAIGKGAGDMIKIRVEEDARPLTLNATFIKCLKDDPRAYDHFKTLPKSHQAYFSKWIEDAKTTPTKTRRITMAVIALGAGQGFPEMLRANKNRNQ